MFGEKIPPTIALRARPQDTHKTVVISGAPRGGTTFGASIAASFGLPFGNLGDVSLRYSNHEIMNGFHQDRARFVAECRKLDQSFDAWAFKLADIARDFDFAQRELRNPHFVFVTKEPVSIAARAMQIKNGAIDPEKVARGTGNILTLYQEIMAFAAATQAPVLFVMYEKAIADLPATAAGFASFLGREPVCPDTLASNLREDWMMYYAASDLIASSKTAGS